jgi:N-acetylglucosamine-6-sulfatase
MKAALRSVASIVGGFVVAAVLVMLVTYVASLALVPGFRQDPMAPPTAPYLVANVFGSFLAAVAGGWLAATLAARAPLMHAGGLGLLMLGMTVASGGEPAPGQPAWYPMTVAVLAALGALAGGGLRRWRADTLRTPLLTATLLLLLACDPTEAPNASDLGAYSVTPEERPNIVVIVVDDMRFDEMGVAGHPYLETPHIDQLARDGAMFTGAFHAVPLCSPNRASILTGQYPSRHGIIDNVARNRMSHRLQTFPQALQADGYETAFMGKWHMGNDPTPRPGWNEWVAIPGQGRTRNPELYEDGRIHEVEGYITDVFTDRAVDFVQQQRDGPFFLYIGHKAIHPDAVQLDDGSVDLTVPRGYVPAPRHLGRYEDEVFTRRANVVASPDDLVGKPALQRALGVKYSEEIMAAWGEQELDPGTREETIRRRSEMLLAVDDGVGRIVETLRSQGILDETVIVFTSDNGFFYGEHGLSLERRMPYEESIRTPLIVRYPGVAEPGTRIDRLVSSIDLAPTALELAGVAIGDHVQGRSFVPLLQGNEAGWRESLLVEFYTYENPFPWLVDMDYRAIRTERYKYIHWMQHPDETELYDLVADPFETRNLVNDPGSANILAELRGQLADAAVGAMGLRR